MYIYIYTGIILTTDQYSQSGAIRAARYRCKAWNVPKVPMKAKVTRRLESTDLAWVLSAHSAEIS